MDWQEYKVRITPNAAQGLRALAKKLGKKLFGQLRAAIEALKQDPEGKTQELHGGLAAYRSLHVSRCRVIIKIENTVVRVYVVAAGWHTSGDRDDVYRQALRALESGELDPDDASSEEE